MRRTAAIISSLLVTVLTLVGISDPADAAPVPAPQPGCELHATQNVSGGVTSSVELTFSFYGVTFLVTPAWSYDVSADDTAAVVASQSFAANNDQRATVDTSGWKTGSYTVLASFGNAYPTCSTTFQMQGLAPVDDPQDVDLPPTATIDCGPSQIVAGTTITVEGTAEDDDGISADKIRFPDGVEKPGNTGTWNAGTVGELAFAYLVIDTAGNQASDLCRIHVVAAPPAQNDPVPTKPAPTNPVPTNPVPTNPVPTNPVPTNPVPTNPVPSNPAPSGPVATTAPETGIDSSSADTAPQTTDTDENPNEGADLVIDESADDQTELDNEEATQDADAGDGDDEAAALVADAGDQAAGKPDEALSETRSRAANSPVGTAEIEQGDKVDAAAAPSAEQVATTGTVNVPWWFLIAIAALAAYKPITDLWRSSRHQGAEQATRG